MIKVIIKKPYEKAYVTEIDNNLTTYQDLVEGYIEYLSYPGIEGVDVICNEEGKLMGLEPNIVIPEYRDTVVGNIVIVGVTEDGQDFGSVADNKIDDVLKDLEERSF